MTRSNGTVLVIDDEKDLVDLLRDNLEKEHFDVICAGDGASGLEIAREHLPDLVVLDLMMPGMDGLEVCRRLRGDPRTAHIPLVMLTARTTEADRVVGLEMGADDYVVKPFSVRELVARIRAVMRRVTRQAETVRVIRIGSVVIDTDRHEVTSAGQPVQLTAAEFRILHYLASHADRVMSRDQIIDAALGKETAVFDRTIDVHITAIRRKLGAAAAHIETVRGFGYKFRSAIGSGAEAG